MSGAQPGERAYIHINRPSSTRFHARWMRARARTWAKVGPARKTEAAAAKDMAAGLYGPEGFRRGEVIMIADYYDPIVLASMKVGA